MALALDQEIADFAGFLGSQLGLANVWMALSADHGIAPIPAEAKKLRIPAEALEGSELRAKVDEKLAARMGKREYIVQNDFSLFFLARDAFGNLSEEKAEQAVGAALVESGMRGYFTKSQLAQGSVPDTPLGRRYLHSYSPYGGWWVMAVPPPYTLTGRKGTTHGAPYSYDTHVPLAFFGLGFRPGTYRTRCEPVDLAPTLASLLGINAPSDAIGRVLTEAIASPPGDEAGGDHR